MKTIWKFSLAVMDKQAIQMPIGAEILAVQLQDTQPCLWAIVDTEAAREDRVIEIHGTGNRMYQDMGVQHKYIGTVQQPPLVWHVFERVS